MHESISIHSKSSSSFIVGGARKKHTRFQVDASVRGKDKMEDGRLAQKSVVLNAKVVRGPYARLIFDIEIALVGSPFDQEM